MSEMLKVSDLHVYYGSIHAVKGVSFEVHEGEVVTLIGANGAGKSTILKDLHGVPAHKLVGMGLAQVPEGRHVFLQMTVQENLEMGAFSQPSSGIEADLESVYQRFPRLLERRKQIAGTLSGGEQQMLAVARALMSRPKLMMMDEPSLGLAPLIVLDIFQIIREINKQGVTILLIEQNANMALHTADRGYVMETGEIILEGAGRELLENPVIREAYLGK